MDFDQTTSRVLSFRRVQPEDSRMIWEWANDPAVRSVSFSTEPIPWESHCKWFSAKLLDPNCLFFIVLDSENIPIGQIRYEVQAEQAVVSVALASGRRGQGYGSQVIRAGSQNVFESTSIQLIHAYIKPDNIPSIQAFSKAGFSDSGFVEVHGNLARDYMIHRKAIKP